jgi:hypothetical protein
VKVYGAFSASRSSTKVRSCSHSPVAEQLVALARREVLAVHPPIRLEPRFGVEADDVDDERVDTFETPARIAVPGERTFRG